MKVDGLCQEECGNAENSQDEERNDDYDGESGVNGGSQDENELFVAICKISVHVLQGAS